MSFIKLCSVTKPIPIYDNICLNGIKGNVHPGLGSETLNAYTYDEFLFDVKESLSAAIIPWNISFSSEKYLQISLYDKKLINGRQAYKILKVFNNLTWLASYAGHQSISSSFSTAPQKTFSFYDFSNITKILENSKICGVVDNPSLMILPTDTKNIQGQTIGSIEEVIIVDDCGNEQKLNVRRSTGCKFFMDTCSLGSRCSNCNTLRRNLSFQIVRFNNNLRSKRVNGEMSKGKSTNKRFLSEEDRNRYNEDQKRMRINAEKREKYWKFKAAEEKKTKNIVREDESDLLDMFNELDKGTGPNGEELVFPDNPNMNLFWEMQRDAVSKRNQKISIRWHPK